VGVKVVNLVTNACVRIIGKGENLRILAMALYQGQPAKLGAAAPTIKAMASANPACVRLLVPLVCVCVRCC